MSRAAVLSDAQWARIELLMPPSEGQRGRPFRDHRQVIEGIVYRLRTGVAWRDLPDSFGRGRRSGSVTDASSQTLRHRRHLGQRSTPGLSLKPTPWARSIGTSRSTPRSTGRTNTPPH